MAGRSPASILFDENGNAIGVLLDGAIYRLQTIGKVLNSSGAAIDPATQGTLASIKDTDGIKKITDALPAGSNTIGGVTQPVAADPWHVDGKGVAGTPSAGVLSIQGVSGGFALPVTFDTASSDPSFVITAEGIAIGNNKSMLSILNGSGSTVAIRIREIYLTNVQVSGVVGVVATFQLRRITGHSAGTDLTTSTIPHDTDDTLDAAVTARTGATVAGEASVNLFRKLQSTDEWGVGSPDNEGYDAAISRLLPVYRQNENSKPITLYADQGVTFKCATNSTAGSFDVTIVFTVGAP